MSSTRSTLKLDPEQVVHHISYALRKVECLNNMPHYTGQAEQQYIDSGYCLDRYSRVDHVHGGRNGQA